MADIVLTADTSQAVNSLKKLQDQTKKLNDSFIGLKSALAGIAFGAILNNAIKFADSIQDISDATNISITAITGFSRAVADNGGSFDGANNSILRFVESVSEANDGSLKLQQSFSDVGVSLEDLRTLSEGDLLRKTIDGLSKIDDVSKRAKTSVDLLGKGLKGVNVSGVANDLNAATANAAKYASAIATASKVQGQIDTLMRDFQLAVLGAIQPIADLASNINIGIDTMSKFIKWALILGGIFLTYTKALPLVTTSISKLVNGLQAGGGVIKVFTTEVKYMGGLVVAVFKNIGRAVGVVATTKTLTTNLLLAFRSLLKVLVRFAGMFGLFYTLAEVIDFIIKKITNISILDTLTDKFKEWYEIAKKFFGLQSEMGGRSTGIGGPTADEMKKYHDEQSKFSRDQVDALKKQKDEIDKIIQGVKDYSDNTLEALSYQTRLVGKTEDEVELLDKLRDLALQHVDARKQLEDKLKNLTPYERQLGLDQQILDAIKNLNIEYEQQIGLVTEYVNRLQGARLIEQDRLRTLENITKEIDDQKNRYQQLGDIMRSADEKLRDVTTEGSMRGKSPMQQQIERIKEDARKAALEAGRAFAQSFEDNGDGLTPEKANELSAGLDQIAQKYKQIADAQIENVLASQTFSAGWQEAFNSYYESATNAATMAQNAFSSFTNAMESAIDKFVETGKFSFKDFAKSVISDLIKIQIKASAMKLLGALGFGNPFAGFFADGGYIPPGKYGVVGEAGPELVSGPAQVTPGSELGGQTINNYITNNISAVDAKSVAVLFAQNRKTLLGATETARKEMPSRMRR